MSATADVIDRLTGIEPGSRLDAIRAGRPQARDNAQASYLALFAPAAPGGLSLRDRFAVATFVAGLHRRPAIQAFYEAELAKNGDPNLIQSIASEIGVGVANGPYGCYPRGPLSAEDHSGSIFRVAAGGREALGRPLAAALDHTHLLVYHPRDASPSALQALLDAGLTTTDVVTLSQIVAFLSFQIRVVEGLSILGAAGEAA